MVKIHFQGVDIRVGIGIIISEISNEVEMQLELT